METKSIDVATAGNLLKRKVFFHGYLRRLVPDGIEMTGRSVAEIINGIQKQVKALRPRAGHRHALSVVGFDSIESLLSPLNDDIKELHLVPAMCGGKSGGLFKIILGVVILTAVFIATGGNGLAAMTATKWAFAATMFASSLILGGLLEIVSPMPKADLGDSVDNSKYLSANGNTVKLGTRIPLFYGEHQWYGHFLSFNVDKTQTDSVPATYDSWRPYELLA